MPRARGIRWSMHEALKAAPLVPRTLVLIPAAIPGGPVITATGALELSYTVLAKIGNLTRANVEYAISGAIDESARLVDGPAVHAASWIGAVSDAGPDAGAGGATVTQRIDQLAGLTSVVGTMQHSADGVVWADLVTFGTVTAAPAAEVVPVAGPVLRYRRATGTVTGTGTVRIMVTLARA